MTALTDSLFVHLATHRGGEAEATRSAIECIEAFTDRFNAQDREGMDARLHFLDELIATGWHRTTYRRKQAAFDSGRWGIKQLSH